MMIATLLSNSRGPVLIGSTSFYILNFGCKPRRVDRYQASDVCDSFNDGHLVLRPTAKRTGNNTLPVDFKNRSNLVFINMIRLSNQNY